MARLKQQQYQQPQSSKNSKNCCYRNIRSFIQFIFGKKKKYTIIQEINNIEPSIVKQEIIISPKRETECKQYYFKGEVILVANDNVRFQEWLRLVESSK